MLVRINHQAVNLAHLTRQELIELKYQVDQESDDIRDQLKRAEAHLKMTGEYADPNWYWSAVRAQKHRTRLSQTIQVELSKRKDRSRASVPDCFMDLARLRLDPALFQELLDEALEKALWQERQHLVNTNP